MFNDGRSKRVVFVAHCFLNQNSISDETAVYPAAFFIVIGISKNCWCFFQFLLRFTCAIRI